MKLHRIRPLDPAAVVAWWANEARKPHPEPLLTALLHRLRLKKAA